MFSDDTRLPVDVYLFTCRQSVDVLCELILSCLVLIIINILCEIDCCCQGMNEVIGPIYYVLANDTDPHCQGN